MFGDLGIVGSRARLYGRLIGAMFTTNSQLTDRAFLGHFELDK